IRSASIALALALLACGGGTSSESDGPLHGVAAEPDAAAALPDAPPLQPDAAALRPDAAAVQPDAPVVHPDAPSVGPDAPPVAPDAPAPTVPGAPPMVPDAAPPPPDAAPPPPDAAPILYTLTIQDFDSWCAISENGSPYLASKKFPAGTVVQLHGEPNLYYVWGYWTGTDAAGSGKDTSQNAEVTMSSDRHVLACCPFPPPASQTCP